VGRGDLKKKKKLDGGDWSIGSLLNLEKLRIN
jgi:hypothetical protein